MTQRVFNVLFLGVNNSAISIMAEALLNRFGSHRFHAFSAGVEAAPAIHPLTLEILKDNNLPTDGLRSKRWQEFRTPNAPPLDFLISLSASSPEDEELAWPAGLTKANWHIADPSLVNGDAAAQKRAFRRAFRELETRIKLFALVHDSAHQRLAGSAANLQPVQT